MTINLCVYSDERFENPRKALVNLAKKTRIFNQIFEYDRDWLESTRFFLENQKVLQERTRGDGWCLWKPYVILESLEKVADDEVVLYMDATDTFIPNLSNFLKNFFKDKDILLSLMGENPNYKFCKRDVFIKMCCDSPKYWNSKQLEAGIIGVKNTQKGKNFIREYLNFCKDPDIITDSPNLLGENFSDFVRHASDQAVLTILGEKNSILPSKDIRHFVECNMWECLTLWDNKADGKKEFDRKVHRVYNDLIKCNEDDWELWEENYLKIICPDA